MEDREENSSKQMLMGNLERECKLYKMFPINFFQVFSEIFTVKSCLN